ncbi:hypothetical protein RI367_004043 [Sorochytrium milnesiophthora]
MADQDEDFSKLPIAERLTHKNWKARSSAYEELTKLFQISPEDSPLYAKHAPDIKKMVTDAHLGAQETGLAAALAFVQSAPVPIATKVAKDLASAVVEKCLNSTRTGTRQKSIELLLQAVEVTETGDTILEPLLTALDNKQPKLVTQAVASLREAVHAFGVKTVNVKGVLKQLPKVFGHSDKNVRSEAQQLAVELHRFIGDTIVSFLSDLKPVQIKELQDLFAASAAANPGRAQPARLTRSQQAAVVSVGASDTLQGEEAAGATTADGAGDVADMEIDSYELAEPVDVLKKMPASFYESMASSKWKDRKEALEQLLEIVKTPRIKDDRYQELVSVLAKRVNDTVLLPATIAVQIIEQLALGLRKDFAPYRGMVVGVLLEKLKEKKQNVVDGLRAALDAVFAATSLEANMEDIMEAWGHKNPQVKLEAIRFLTRCLQNTRKAPNKAEIKTVCEAMLKSIDDPSIDARDASAEVLGTLMRVIGERPMLAYLERVDSIKSAKVKEFSEKAQVKLGGARAPAAATAAVAARRPPAAAPPPLARAAGNVKAPVSSAPADGARPVNGAAVRPPLGKPAAAKSTKPASASAPASKPASKATAAASVLSDEPAKCRTTYEEAEAKVQGLTSESLIAELADGAWKIRLTAMTALLEHISNLPAAQQDAEAFTLLLSKKPGFKENNFQVAMKVIELLKQMAGWQTFHSGLAAMAIPSLIDRFSDMKLKKLAGDCLCQFAEALSFQFVLNQAYEPLNGQKSPKVLVDALMWIHSSLLEFGVVKLNIRSLVEFVKAQLGNSNAKVREAATAVLSNVRIFVGPDVKNFVADLNPQLLATIEGEFAKVADRQPPKITRPQGTLFSVSASASNVGSASVLNSGSTGGAVDEEDALDSLFPRQDISAQITEQLLEELNNHDWKVRKEGLEKVAEVVQAANNRLKPPLGDLPSALKARLADSNKNLAVITLELVSKIATAMGSPFERHVRVIGPGVCACFADNKVHVRAAALAALNAIVDVTKLPALVPVVASSLSADNPTLRQELMKWVNEQCAKQPDASLDLSPLIAPVVSSLQHRDANVRKQAQALLDPVIRSAGFEAVRAQLSDLKGVALQSLSAVLEQHRPTAGRTAAQAPSASASANRQPSPGRHAPRPASPTASDNALAVPGIPRPKSLIMRRSSSVSRSGGEEAAAPEGAAPAASDVPVLPSDPRSKDKRAQDDRGSHKWVLDGPRPDLQQYLRDQMAPHFSAALLGQLFSTDHYKERDHLAALVTLTDLIVNPASCEKAGLQHDDAMQRLTMNSDLLLKYLTLRFLDTNTSVIIKSLDLLEALCNMLVAGRYNMTEYEAAAFLPSLIVKIGDSKEVIRQRIHVVLRLIMQMYPPSKLFAHIIRFGLESKNARTRAECLEELGFLLSKVEVSAFQPSKSFPIIAAQIGDRDSSVRNAALNTIVQAAMTIGEAATLKFVGKLPDKEKALLDEKLRRSDIPAAAAPAASVAPDRRTSYMAAPQQAVPQPQRRQSMSSNGNPFLDGSAATSGGPIAPQALSEERLSAAPGRRHEAEAAPAGQQLSQDSLSLNIQDLPQLSNKYQTVPQPLALKNEKRLHSPMLSRSHPAASQTKDYIIDYIISQITSGDANEAVNALKRLETEIRQNPEIVVSQSNQVINAMTLQIRLAFVSLESQGPHVTRLCKYLLNALLNLYDNAMFAKSVNRNSLLQLLMELLTRLLDSNLPRIEYGPQLARAVNMIMMKILERSDRNVIFGVLLEMLETAAHNTLVAEEPQLADQVKLADLIMKCIWKLIRYIQESFRAQDFKVDVLLRDMDVFLARNTPSEWKRRGQEQLPLGDVPLRTMKTLMSELISNFGEGIFEHCGYLAETSYVRAYLRQLLEASKRKLARSTSDNAVISPPTSATARSPPSSSSALTAATKSRDGSHDSNLGGEHAMMSTQSSSETITQDDVISTDRELAGQLDTIFARIGSKDHSKAGIVELYDFKLRHPHMHARIDEKVAQTGSFFQNYIRRNLAQLEKERAATPTDVVMTDAAPTTERPRSVAAVEQTPAHAAPSQTESLRQRFSQLRSVSQSESSTPPANAAAATPTPPAAPSIQPSASFTTTNTLLAAVGDTQSSTAARSDAERSHTVLQLKERLARMKQNMRSASAMNSATGGSSSSSSSGDLPLDGGSTMPT